MDGAGRHFLGLIHVRESFWDSDEVMRHEDSGVYWLVLFVLVMASQHAAFGTFPDARARIKLLQLWYRCIVWVPIDA